MANRVVSLGYEGRNIEQFLEVLLENEVTTVADVRLNAISRKPGFSKKRLASALADAGIQYRHFRNLGNQKSNREPFWKGDVKRGCDVFRKSIASEAAATDLEALGELVSDGVVAVVCFEANHDFCHRQVLTDELALANSQVGVVRA